MGGRNLNALNVCGWRSGVARLAIVGALAAGAPAARAMDDADKPDALRGPSVKEEPKDASLVQRDFSGKIKRLDTDPTLAALEKISLTPEEKAAAEKIITERNTILDRLVLDNLQELVALNGARQAGDRAGARAKLADLLEKMKPLTSRGRLVDELKSVLPESKHAELVRLTGEYTQASIADRMENPEAQGEMGAALAKRTRNPRAGAAAAEFLENFGQEIKRSYERVLGSRAKDFDKLINQLQLSPEQEAKVRRIATDLIQKANGKPSPRETTRAFFEIYRELDVDQRQILRDRIREQRGERPEQSGSGK